MRLLILPAALHTWSMSRFVCLALALLTLNSARGEIISIAAAANFALALDALNLEFKKFSPTTSVAVSTGASGSIVAQIKTGAPYDVFLSADLEYPKALIKAGEADEKSLVTFATGRLVLWTTKPGAELKSVSEVLRDPAVKKIAIANVDTAPYGRAAKAVLEKLGAWNDVKAKLVTGESITQTAQFVESGNADAGFVSLSVVLAPRLKGQGRYLEVPAVLYPPLAHGAILTNRGAKKNGAKDYVDFLRSPLARRVLEEFGYAVPK